MAVFQGPNLLSGQKVKYINISDIAPNPAQPRKLFDYQGLRELSESISQIGILQPLTVRKCQNGYELVSGERRLRAAAMCGLKQVPCLVIGVDAEQSSILALVENLQRRDLDFIEEAEGLGKLISVYGMSQEEAARRLGKSQSAISNKLRVLKHPPDILALLRAQNLTERHARALLRLDSFADRRGAIEKIVGLGMNVAQTDQYIDDLLASRGEAPPSEQKGGGKVPRFILKDVRLFFNTIRNAVNIIRQSGLRAEIRQEETESEYLFTIYVSKRKDDALQVHN